MSVRINGIQQLGVGVEKIEQGWSWYRKYFGMDIKVFEDEAIAKLMLKHTNNESRPRHALLAMNLEGGGGFEVWQHTGKTPEPASFDVHIGDLGICIGKLKTKDITSAYRYFVNEGLKVLGEIKTNPAGQQHFFLKDPFNNTWEIVQHSYVLFPQKSKNGGVLGTTIGVKNIEESLVIYKDILGYDQIMYDETGTFEDLSGLPYGDQKYRRVLLNSSRKLDGAFSALFGPSEIELIQAMDRKPQDIYKGRIWGDPGFIHLCFDINGMEDLRELVKEKGFPFTVDSAVDMDTFDMGEAAGNFSYIQAPEGTLIEFVETHKVPLLKSLGLYINLRKRGRKPLPNWILKLFALKRVKN